MTLPSNWQPAPPGYKHVVSVSLGSSKRNAREEIEVLGQPFILERLGTDGDSKRMMELFNTLDGKVDAFGLGGADLYVVSGGKRYTFGNVRKSQCSPLWTANRPRNRNRGTPSRGGGANARGAGAGLCSTSIRSAA